MNILNGYYFYNKSFITDIRLGFIQVLSKNIEIFEVKIRWSKSSRLLQGVAFLVFNWERFIISERSVLLT